MPGISTHNLADTRVRITRVQQKASREFDEALSMGRSAWRQADWVGNKCPQARASLSGYAGQPKNPGCQPRS